MPISPVMITSVPAVLSALLQRTEKGSPRPTSPKAVRIFPIVMSVNRINRIAAPSKMRTGILKLVRISIVIGFPLIVNDLSASSSSSVIRSGLMPMTAVAAQAPTKTIRVNRNTSNAIKLRNFAQPFIFSSSYDKCAAPIRGATLLFWLSFGYGTEPLIYSIETDSGYRSVFPIYSFYTRHVSIENENSTMLVVQAKLIIPNRLILIQ